MSSTQAGITGVNADVFIEFLKRLVLVGATHPIFPASWRKHTKQQNQLLKVDVSFAIP